MLLTVIATVEIQGQDNLGYLGELGRGIAGGLEAISACFWNTIREQKNQVELQKPEVITCDVKYYV